MSRNEKRFAQVCFILLTVVTLVSAVLHKTNLELPVTVLVLLVFFLFYLNRLLSFRGQQDVTEPLWVERTLGIGIGLNPKNPLGFRASLVITTIVFLLLVVLLLSDFVLLF